MEFFVGLDVSLDETHICVVDEGGRIIKETRALSEPQAIAKANPSSFSCWSCKARFARSARPLI